MWYRFELWTLKDLNKPFPTGQNDVNLMKWRIQKKDDNWQVFSTTPVFLYIHSIIKRTYSDRVIGRKLSFTLFVNLLASVQFVRPTKQPAVTTCSGSTEFAVSHADSSEFLPVPVEFPAANNFSDVKIHFIYIITLWLLLLFSSSIQYPFFWVSNLTKLEEKKNQLNSMKFNAKN